LKKATIVALVNVRNVYRSLADRLSTYSSQSAIADIWIVRFGLPPFSWFGYHPPIQVAFDLMLILMFGCHFGLVGIVLHWLWKQYKELWTCWGFSNAERAKKFPRPLKYSNNFDTFWNLFV